jgi:hypothetical protein
LRGWVEPLSAAIVRREHPLRTIPVIVDAALSRPAVPSEELLRALLLQAFYDVRLESMGTL